jgi:O-antigen/teichoic acid export membrane protein
MAASVASVVQLLIYVGVTLLLLRLNVSPFLALYAGLLAQNVFMGILYLIDLGTWKLVIHLPSIQRSIKFSALLAPSVLGAWLSMLTGKYMIGKFMDLESVGIYEACNRVAVIVLSVMQPLFLATIPIIYEKYREEGFPAKYRLLLNIHLVAVLGLVIVFSLFNRELVLMVVGAKYVEHAFLVYPFLLVAVLAYLAHFPANNIHLAQKSQYDSVIEITAGVVNVGLTYVLMCRWGFSGAVGALVIVYALRYTLYLLTGNRLFPSLKTGVPGIAAYFGGCLGLMAAHYLLRDAAFLLRALVCVVEGAAVVLVFLRLSHVSPRQVLALFRKEGA